jgi:hypothetical protein
MTYKFSEDRESQAVIRWYLELNLTARMYRVLSNAQPNLNIAIIGPTGYGKTTYAYYALKTAWLLHNALLYCRNHNSNREKCSINDKDNALRMIIDYIKDVHNDNVCAKKQCTEPDVIDPIVQPIYFTGFEGLKELINILKKPREHADRLRFLFLDDVWSRSLYSLGGAFRLLYQALNDYLRMPREYSKIIIATGQKKDFVPPALLQPRSVHYANYTVIKDDNGRLMNVYEYRVWTREVYKKRYIGRFGPYERWVTNIDQVYSDVVPKKAIFGLPEWLEKNINDRKTFEISASAERAYKALERMESENNDKDKKENNDKKQ